MSHPNHQNYQNHHRGATKRGGGSGDPTTSLQPGQVSFRLLCHVNTAGGVIGNSGSIIKQLEEQTGSKIRFEESLQNCHERVINIIGEAAIDRKITLKRENFFGNGGDEAEAELMDVSKAQEGLIRVFERVLEVEGNGNGAVGCRLLAGSGQIGAVLGKGGKIVDAIRKSSGAKIKVLKKEQIPACALAEEELIQIMGASIAVKKALLGVSRRLQDRSPLERVPPNLTSTVQSSEQRTDIRRYHTPSTLPLSSKAAGNPLDGNSLSADVHRTLSIEEESPRHKVVFRLLCSNSSAGGIIGKGANIVKALEKETGASIKFASPVSGSKERVATISSFENQDPLYSPAQIAIVRVFSRSMEVGLDQGLISGLGKGETVSARILVASDQIDCLMGGGKVAPDISAASGVEIQLLESRSVPNCAEENDIVVQIVGEYENVKSALFQVTGKLREGIFSTVVPERAGQRHISQSTGPDNGPNGVRVDMSPQFDRIPSLSSLDQMDHLGFVRKEDRPPSPRLQHKQDNWNGMRPEHNIGGRANSLGMVESVSSSPDGATNKTVEIIVPEKLFGSVYGENGSNLARLREISGATVFLQDPRPGQSDGRVIICGTPDRIQVAQSLLHAFILI